MPLNVNLHHLEAHPVQLQGELTVEELELDSRDEMIRAESPLSYDLEVQKVEDGLLVHGRLHLILHCQCVRCLKPFDQEIILSNWTRLCTLQGEEKVELINHCADLTPKIREDILLEFPRHPLCETNCRGLPERDAGKTGKTSGAANAEQKSSTWAALDKLKL